MSSRVRRGPDPPKPSGAACLVVLIIFFCAAQTATADYATSVFRPVSPPADAIRSLLTLVLAVSAVIFLVVEGSLGYIIVRFRRRAAAGTEPPQFYGSGPVELAWTVAPLLIVFVLFLIVTRTVLFIEPARPLPGSLDVTVVGHQWWWEFDYPTYGFRTANELHVPAAEPNQPRSVALTLLSADVIHSFWVPRLAGKTDLIPGHTNHMWFQADQPGEYHGHCAEYCGVQHANMLILVIATPPTAFERWAAWQQQPAVADPAVAADRQRFLGLPCANCHTVRGTTAAGRVGPDLTHLMSRETIGAGVLTNTPAHVTAWVSDPQRTKPGCHMPDLQLSPAIVEEVVRYLETLR